MITKIPDEAFNDEYRYACEDKGKDVPCLICVADDGTHQLYHYINEVIDVVNAINNANQDT